MSEGYKLDIAEAPERNAHGIYDVVVADFIKSVLDNSEVKTKSARVTMPGKQIKTMQVGLAKAARTAGRKDIKVAIREGIIYLIRK